MKNNKMMGIIFSNMHDECMGELTDVRSAGSIPYGGRYRLIDFTLSSMVNSGVKDIGVVTRQNYQSLMDHIGSGRAWDLSRKVGGLRMLPPYARGTDVSDGHPGCLEALAGRLSYLRSVDAQYVVLSGADTVSNIDLRDVLRQHQETGADITAVYADCRREVPGRDVSTVEVAPDGRLTDVSVNVSTTGNHKEFLNIALISRELLIKLVTEGYAHGKRSFTRDVMQAHMDDYKIYGYEAKGFVARITGMESYFAANMALLNSEARAQLFPAERPVFTKVRDEVPAKYGLKAKVENSLVADGCVIEGELENCIVFRGARVGRGAVLKNCIIMQDAIVGENANLNYVIADKNVVVRSGRTLCGYTTIPFYLQKGMSV